VLSRRCRAVNPLAALGLHYTAAIPIAASVLAAISAIAVLRQVRWALKLLRAALVANAAGWLVYWVPFIVLDYSLAEVFWNTSPGLPLWLRLASAWAGAGGSLYLFSVIASLAGLYVLRRRATWALSVAVALVVVSSAVAAMLNYAFTLVEQAPLAGSGLNPLLKNIWLYPHPLLTFSGYAVLAIASLAILAGARREGYILYELGWAFLTLGILVGGYWSYETFGWGGYWAWDPVETGQLMVWLVATLLPHLAAITPRFEGFVAAWLLSSIYLSMYITRTGLSPLHGFGAPGVGALLLLGVSVVSFMYAMYVLYRSVEAGGAQLLSAIGSRDLSRVGLSAASLALLAASIIVYGSLFLPSVYAAIGFEARVPQMEEGVRFYHPLLYPLLVVLMAALPAAFGGKWLGWRGYIALIATVTSISTALAVAVLVGALELAPLSPLSTNVMMAFGLPWAGVGVASTSLYLASRLKRGLGPLARDRLALLALLHLGLSLTVVGVLVSGTYSFNKAYEREYVLRLGDSIELPGGVRLVFEDYRYGIEDDVVDIYTRYVGRSASYFYGQLALATLANDLASVVQDYEIGKDLIARDPSAKVLISFLAGGDQVYLGRFIIEGRAYVDFVNLAANTTVVLAVDEPITIELTNVTLSPSLEARSRAERQIFTIRVELRASELRLELPRNVSTFMPPVLSVHELIGVRFSEPVVVELGSTSLVLYNLTIAPEALYVGGRGDVLNVSGNTIYGRDAALTITSGVVVINGTRIRVPSEPPRPLLVYYVVSNVEAYTRLLSELRDVGLYDILRTPSKIVQLVLREGCSMATLMTGACRAYVDAPKTVPETAWLDVKLRVDLDGRSEVRVLRVRFEAYGEVQGIHGLVPKVMTVGVGLDEVYVVVNPPLVRSLIYGEGVKYHELLIYYLYEVFKSLEPEKRLALAAVMAGGYLGDFVRGLSPQQAMVYLENSVVDLYVLASKFDPSNSTLISEGLQIKVKIVPGVRLVWLGPVVMAVSSLLLAILRAATLKR
jgi:cytochrome c-type biogenesis protein CcmF